MILAKYLLHNNKTLFYMDHTLYRLDKTKIIFQSYCPINVKTILINFLLSKISYYNIFYQIYLRL